MSRHLASLVLLAAAVACATAEPPSPRVELLFCSSLDAEERCVGPASSFPPGELWVLLEADSPFTTDHIKSRVFHVGAGDPVFLDEQIFPFESRSDYAFDSMTLVQPGEYLVTFETPSGDILASRRLVIEQPAP